MARNYVIQLCVPVSIMISFLFLGCAASYPRKNETGGKAVSISTAPTWNVCRKAMRDFSTIMMPRPC